MSIKNMHYDLNIKINKIDSQQYKNLRVPEKDWILNEAYELFVKMVAEPRLKKHLGFEINQRAIDDIRALVIRDECSAVVNNIWTLPNDYWHYLDGYVTMTKGGCSNIRGEFKVKQHDDEFEQSPFDCSSFEWREVNGVFYDGGIKLFTDGTFTINNLCMHYIKKLAYIHNAEDFHGGTYNLPSGTALAGHVDCELPDHTHREIVDIAVLLITGQLEIPSYKVKQNKLMLNNLN